MKGKTFKKVMVGVLVASCILTITPQTIAYAKPKTPTLNVKSITIPIGKITKDSQWDKEDKEYGMAWCSGADVQLKVKNKKKGEKITYTVADPKTVRVDGKGWPTGVKEGKTTVSVRSGSKKIGTVDVTVKKAYTKQIDGYDYICRGDGDKCGFGYETVFYRNQDAKYKCESSDNNFVVEKTAPSGMVYLNSKKTGTYKLKVKETYKGKSRYLKSLSFTVVNPEPEKDYVCKVGDVLFDENLIHYNQAGIASLKLTKGEGTVIEPVEYGGLKAIGKGTAEFDVIDTDGNSLGIAVVTVK